MALVEGGGGAIGRKVVISGVTFTVRKDGTIVAPGGKVMPKGTVIREVAGRPTIKAPKGVIITIDKGTVRVGQSPVERIISDAAGKTASPRPAAPLAPRKAVPATATRGTSAPPPAPAPRPAAPTASRGTSAPVARPAVTGGSAASVAPRTGTGAAPTSAPRPTTATTAKTDAEVRRMFGDVAAFLTDPELGPILRKAAAEGWDDSRLMGALQQTKFWRTKGDSERKWIILNRLDNAEARRQVEQQAQGIWDLARQGGLNPSGLQVHDLAVNALKFGWTGAEMREQVFNVATKQPGGLDTAVATQYGYLAAFLDNPEVGPLLERAAREGWPQVRLEAELQKTNFWKTTTESQRRFNAASEQDPASVQQQVSARNSELLTMAQSLGVTVDPVKLKQIAEDSLRYGWNDSQIRRSITAEFDYQGGESGVAGQSARQIKNRAAEFLVPISDQAMEQWTEKMVRGEIDMEGFDAYLVEQAKSLFPGMVGALDRGITVAQYVDPYKQMVARELEINPESIDLMDPRYRKMFDQVNGKGERTVMTLSESAEYLRKLPEWQQTRGANERAAMLTENILKTFGAVA